MHDLDGQWLKVCDSEECSYFLYLDLLQVSSVAIAPDHNLIRQTGKKYTPLSNVNFYVVFLII